MCIFPTTNEDHINNIGNKQIIHAHCLFIVRIFNKTNENCYMKHKMGRLESLDVIATRVLTIAHPNGDDGRT